MSDVRNLQCTGESNRNKLNQIPESPSSTPWILVLVVLQVAVP